MIARMISRGLNKRGADIGSARTSEDVAVLRAVSKFQSHQGCKLVSSVRWMSTPVLHGLFGIVGSSIIAEEAGLLTRAFNYELGDYGSSGYKLMRRREA